MQHQKSHATHYDRYPEIFKQVSNLFYIKENKRILSFGCSYGDEILALREKYFNESIIDGVDINPIVVKDAKLRTQGASNNIMEYEQFVADTETKYDCIFAMSVFCRWEDTEHTENCSRIYPFSAFNNGLHLLDSKLKVDGVLVIYNANFLFEDSLISKKYVHIPHQAMESGFVHKFNKANQKLYNEPAKFTLLNYEKAIFRKVKP